MPVSPITVARRKVERVRRFEVQLADALLDRDVAVRAAYATGEVSIRQLAELLGVSHQTVYASIKGLKGAARKGPARKRAAR